MQPNAVHTVQFSAKQCGATQYIAVKYSAVQNSAEHCLSDNFLPCWRSLPWPLHYVISSGTALANSITSAVSSVKCALFSVTSQCAVFCVPYAACSVQRTVFSLECAVCSILLQHKCTAECKSVNGNVRHDKNTICRIWIRLTIPCSWG